MVSLMDVQARWVYSEILEGTLAKFYDGGLNTDALRERRKAGLPFDDLTADERYTLAFQGAHVRQTLFVFFIGIEHFDLLQLTQEQLGKLIVPPDVWLDSQGQFYLFSHYITTTTDEPVDARSVQQPADGYKAPTDPLTLGKIFNNPVLLDGYHRAALFWKYGPADGIIPAYMPRLAK